MPNPKWKYVPVHVGNLKSFKPTYNMIELLINPLPPEEVEEMREAEYIAYVLRDVKKELIRFDKAVKQYGECEFISAVDYPDTKTTSIQIYDPRRRN